jgi:hypothetical protein
MSCDEHGLFTLATHPEGIMTVTVVVVVGGCRYAKRWHIILKQHVTVFFFCAVHTKVAPDLKVLRGRRLELGGSPIDFDAPRVTVTVTVTGYLF